MSLNMPEWLNQVVNPLDKIAMPLREALVFHSLEGAQQSVRTRHNLTGSPVSPAAGRVDEEKHVSFEGAVHDGADRVSRFAM